MKPEAVQLESHAAPDEHIQRLANKAEEDVFFFGHALRQFAESRFGGRMEALREWIGVTEEQLLHMRICRRPGDPGDLEKDCQRLAEVYSVAVEKIREIVTHV